MNKHYCKIVRFCVFLLAVVTVSSCGRESRGVAEAFNRIDFDTISVAERHYLEKEGVGPYCDISVNLVYPVGADDYDLDFLKDVFVTSMFGDVGETGDVELVVNSYVESYFKNYEKDADTYQVSISEIEYLEDLGGDLHSHTGDDDHDQDYVFYSYYERLSDSIVFNKNDVLSFQVRQANRKGGVSSNYVSYTNYVVNLKSGSLVVESDIFEPGYDKALQNLIITSLLEQNKVSTVRELEDIGFFGLEEIYPNGNFLLTDKGVIYTYNKGEYSAVRLETPEVFIPYSSIRSLLRENSIASKLANI